MAQFLAVKTGASNDDIMEALRAIHQCMEKRFDQIEREQAADLMATHALRQKDRAGAENALKAMDDRMKDLERAIALLVDGEAQTNTSLDAVIADQTRIKTVLGADSARGHVSLAAMSQRSFIWRAIGALGAVTLAYKLIWAAAPSLWHALLAVNATLLR